jgi:hypothetical protein
MRKSNLFHFFLLGLLFTSAAFFRLHQLKATDIGTDESFSLYIAQLPAADIIQTLKKGDNPPLWELLASILTDLLGFSLFNLRIVSTLASILTGLGIWLLGSRFLDKTSGLLAASFFLFSNFGFFIAHEARVYSLLGLLIVLSSCIFLRIIAQKTVNKLWIWLGITNTLIFYSHYLGLYIVLIQFITLLLNRQDKKYWIAFTKASTLLFLLSIPQIPTLLNRFLASGTSGTWVPQTSGIKDIYFMVLKFTNAPILAVLSIVVLLYSLIVLFKKKSILYTYLSLWFWLPLLLTFFISFKVSFFLDRYLYFVLPGLSLLLLATLKELGKYVKYGYVSLGSLFALLFIVTFKPSVGELRYSGYHKPVKPLVSNILQHQEEPNTAVVLSPLWLDKDIVFYAYPELFTSYFTEKDSTSFFKEPLKAKSIYSLEFGYEFDTIGYEKVLFLDDNSLFSVPNNGIYDSLSRWYHLYDSIEIEKRRLYYFKRS